MTYVKQIGLADIPAFMNLVRTQLTLHGWTIHEINSSTALPPERTFGEEFVARSNGKLPGSGDPAQHVVGFHIVNEAGAGPHSLGLFGASGMKGPVDLSQVTYSGSTVTCQTATPHPFRDGDLVMFGGVDIQDMNRPPAGFVQEPNKVTLVGAPGVSVAWTQPMADTGPGGTGTTGKAFALYNFCGYRTWDGGTNSRIFLANAAMDVFLFVDEYSISGVIGQSGGYYHFFAGRPGREHVQAEASGAALVANASDIVSDGIAASTIDLDRSITGKLYVGAKIQAYNPENAQPESVGVHRTVVTPVAVTAVNSATQIEAVLPAGTYNPGAMVGMDSAACIVGASRIINLSMFSNPMYASFAVDGASSDSQSVSHGIRVRSSTNEETDNDPDGKGEYHGSDLVFADFRGVRKYVPGFIGVTRGVQNDGDLMIGGDPANSPAGDYIIFPSFDIESYIPGLGPGAS